MLLKRTNFISSFLMQKNKRNALKSSGKNTNIVFGDLIDSEGYMKKIKTEKGYKFYEATNEQENDGYKYALYLPDESPYSLDYPEFQADNLQELSDFIR